VTAPEYEEEPTPLFFAVIHKEDFMSTPTPDSGDVDPQEPGTVTGYRKHTQQEVDVVNTNKGMENDLGLWLKQLRTDVPDADPRWLALARTHFQEGFMALNRAVFRPDSEL
jgi:hypothetical protein